jgi:hypothetical protein
MAERGDEREEGRAVQALAKVRDALNGLRYGEVTVVVQDSGDRTAEEVLMSRVQFVF